MTPRDDEFYIGYEAQLPRGIARAVRIAVAAALATSALVVFAVTLAQRPLAPSAFAFGTTSEWSGFYRHDSVPVLLVPRSGGRFERVWLVGLGKHGAALEFPPDTFVTIRGSLATRDPWRMVEVHAARAATPPAGITPPAPGAHASIAADVRGEIVDSKCFLGVMNPGERVVHRDCAVRCLSGGVPAMVSFTDDSGRTQLAVLVTSGRPVPASDIAPFVGRPVRLTGRLTEAPEGLLLELDDVSEARP